jgi:hypothetical protein
MLLQHALALAKRGRHVFPCRPRDKVPATSHGCKDATVDANTIRRWWGQEPEFNVAVATGEASGIFVLDVDGDDGEASLRQLEKQNGALPPSAEAITAHGRHIYFRWPDRPIANSAGKIALGLDIRAANGYVLAPPSIHPSGRAYCWSVDTAPLDAAPEWLLALAGSVRCDGAIATTPPAEWRELAAGVAEGARNCTAAKLAGHLLRRYVDPIVTLELLLGWNDRCRPPLSEGDIERIVDSISARELRRRGCA